LKGDRLPVNSAVGLLNILVGTVQQCYL